MFTVTPSFKPKEVTSPIETPLENTATSKSSPFTSFSFTKPVNSKLSPAKTDYKPVTQINQSLFDIPPSEIQISKTREESNDSLNVEDFESTAEFTPVIPLPELIEVKTGEEDAVILFESKAKLLRYDFSSKEWKERGVGQMKVLKFEDTIRLVMRREQILKICCNHQLFKNINFSHHRENKKAISWYANDFSEGVLVKEFFVIRFKTEELAANFLKVIVDSQALLNDSGMLDNQVKSGDEEVTKSEKKIKSSAETQKKSGEISLKSNAWGDKYKPKLGTWTCKNCYVANGPKTSLCEACETPKSDSVSKKDIGNSTPLSPGNIFSPAEDTQTCKSCSTKNVDKFNSCVSCNSSKTPTTEKKEPFDLKQHSFGPQSLGVSKSWGSEFKPKEGAWECKSCLVQNVFDKSYCVSCEAPKDDTIPQKKDGSNKSINLDTPGLKFSFGMPTTTVTGATFAFGSAPTTNAATFSFGHQNNPTISTNLSSTSNNFTFSIKTTEAQKNSNENQKNFVFGSPQKHTFEFTPRSPRRQSSGHVDDESEGSYVEEEEDNIYFKPVIPLPEKVNVKTGEEEEIILYCQRSKLFRFVDGEWKERGIGDVKILKNASDNKLR